jgi:hypothetical protein
LQIFNILKPNQQHYRILALSRIYYNTRTTFQLKPATVLMIVLPAPLLKEYHICCLLEMINRNNATDYVHEGPTTYQSNNCKEFYLITKATT